MYVCIYIYIYVYVCIYIYTYIYIYIYIPSPYEGDAREPSDARLLRAGLRGDTI